MDASPGQILDANGNDISQDLMLKVSRSRSRLAMKSNHNPVRARNDFESTTNWISETLSNLTIELPLERKSYSSRASVSSQSTKGRIISETYVTGYGKEKKLAAVPEPNQLYRRDFRQPESSTRGLIEVASREGGIMELFKFAACDGRDDVDDIASTCESTYTAHRDSRGVIVYEV
jgi:hypothetical protein